MPKRAMKRRTKKTVAKNDSKGKRSTSVPDVTEPVPVDSPTSPLPSIPNKKRYTKKEGAVSKGRKHPDECVKPCNTCRVLKSRRIARLEKLVTTIAECHQGVAVVAIVQNRNYGKKKSTIFSSDNFEECVTSPEFKTILASAFD